MERSSTDLFPSILGGGGAASVMERCPTSLWGNLSTIVFQEWEHFSHCCPSGCRGVTIQNAILFWMEKKKNPEELQDNSWAPLSPLAFRRHVWEMCEASLAAHWTGSVTESWILLCFVSRDGFGSWNLTLAMNNLWRAARCTAGCLSGLVISDRILLPHGKVIDKGERKWSCCWWWSFACLVVGLAALGLMDSISEVFSNLNNFIILSIPPSQPRSLALHNDHKLTLSWHPDSPRWAIPAASLSQMATPCTLPFSFLPSLLHTGQKNGRGK